MAKREVTMVFDTEELRDEFFAWLCDGGGEQSFFDSCDAHEIQTSGLDYWDGGDFLSGVVRVKGPEGLRPKS